MKNRLPRNIGAALLKVIPVNSKSLPANAGITFKSENKIEVAMPDIEIKVTIKRTTTRAAIVNYDDREIILPLSQIKIINMCGEITIKMPVWLAIEKDIV